ncbi:pyruvate, water dikinase regulatory protein [Lutimonas zeaxanthinifaciens]|uniref:pyruvate, water dikinase regulatory protein n=1 Tax=Lutimonas zeaxanthinifaciens TaxID=3060215 RepID=UPI00265D4BAB|nr:pyruvate, water dikinase regulatory protein [Lutimonas sp. YSD2104]WKK65710.1 pyruvate, water dikinase regulatory protein [Lutimonas sp. YSD2104]
MRDRTNKAVSIFVVSGGKGVTGHTIVQTLIIQYPENKLNVKLIPDVRTEEKVLEVIKKVKDANGILTHTMVNSDMRSFLIEECEKQEVKQADLMGGLANIIENDYGLPSLNTPGLYHKINAQYYKRIEAMEYTLHHDDGLNAQDLRKADIVVTGVSRCGKTPLSVYMSMFGWKVANIPLVKGIDPPKELFEIDKNRVFGLNINLNHLVIQRQKRWKGIGNLSNMNYTDTKTVGQELQYAKFLFKRGGFTQINISNKAIESTANEIIGLIIDRFGEENQFIED